MGAVGILPWGTHFCQYYETEPDFLGIMESYFRVGLAAHEACLWITAPPWTLEHAQSIVRERFQERVEDITVRPYSEWYLDRDGAFQGTAILHSWRACVTAALERGYTGLRGIGTLSWRKPDAQIIEYENALEQHLEGLRILVMCAYPLAQAGAAELLDVASVHQVALARRHGKWQILETPTLKATKLEMQRRVEERTLQLGEASDELRRLAARLRTAQEDEGARISRELHDQLGSLLTGLKWQVEELPRLTSLAEISARVSSLTELLDTSIETVRRISAELRPPLLDDLGLVAALEWQAESFAALTGIACECVVSLDDRTVTPEQARALFRICQEALTNTMRHAGASRVTVCLGEEGEDIVLEIRDDGVGITDETVASSTLGLVGMRERAQLLGGSLSISGQPGQGTTLTVRLPKC